MSPILLSIIPHSGKVVFIFKILSVTSTLPKSTHLQSFTVHYKSPSSGDVKDNTVDGIMTMILSKANDQWIDGTVKQKIAKRGAKRVTKSSNNICYVRR